MANTKCKGDIAEIEVLCFLKKNGFHVSIPWGENGPYDLLSESQSGRLCRLQVRSSSWSGGAIVLSLRSTSKNYSRTIDRSRIDAFVLWDGEFPYFIPVEDTMGCVAELRLRDGLGANGQSKGIRQADDYRNKIHLIS